MVLRLPLEKAKQVGMRKLANNEVMEGAMKTLQGRARIKRTMSRRAQEYEAKINSGDLIATLKWCATCSAMKINQNSHTPSASFTKRRWNAWHARLRPSIKRRMMRQFCRLRQFWQNNAVHGTKRRGRLTQAFDGHSRALSANVKPPL